MAKCKDCFHHEACSAFSKIINAAVDVETGCEHFKNRTEVVEVVHGRWIAVPSSDMITGKAYKCSECGKMRYGSYMPNYCQCCGADMRGDTE